MDDLARLARDFARAGDEASDMARGVVQRGCLNVKNDWRDRWSGFAHAPLLPLSVTYETHDRADGPEGRVGPDKDKPQGALGNLFEYGSSKNAPIPGGAPALEAEAPRFEKALADAAERLL